MMSGLPINNQAVMNAESVNAAVNLYFSNSAKSRDSGTSIYSEALLNNFRMTGEAIDYSKSMLYISHCCPPSIAWYCLSIFEYHQIWDAWRWPLEEIQRQRTNMWTLLAKNVYADSYKVENKLIKILTTFAMHMESVPWPQLLSDILSLKLNQRAAFGLLENITVEFVSKTSLVTFNESEILISWVRQRLGSLVAMLLDQLKSYTNSVNPHSTTSTAVSVINGLPTPVSNISPTFPSPHISSELSKTCTSSLNILRALFECDFFYQSPYIIDALSVLFGCTVDAYDTPIGLGAINVLEEFFIHKYNGKDSKASLCATSGLLRLLDHYLANTNDLNEKDSAYTEQIFVALQHFTEYHMPSLIQIEGYPIHQILQQCLLLISQKVFDSEQELVR